MTRFEPRGKWLTVLCTVSLLNLACPGELTPDGGAGGGAAGGTAGGLGGSGGGPAGGSAGGFVDVDVVAARFNPDGGLDTTFGDGGITRLDLGTATASGNRDIVWSMAKDDTDRLVLFTTTRGAGGRTDNDRVIVRLSADGVVDTAFAGGGQFRLDTDGLSDTSRHGVVQTDGKIVSAGYVTLPNGTTADGGPQTTNAPALVRLDSTGAVDTSFGDAGIARPFPAAFQPADGGAMGMVETYCAAPTLNGEYVTTGYGRLGASGTVDMISLRLTQRGDLDPSWSSNQGFYSFDLIGADERGRNVVVLPDGRPVITGSGAPTTPGVLDALVLILTAGG